MLTKNAEQVWQYLHGIICVYKPPETTWQYVANKIRHNICKDLNNLETRPTKKYIDVDYNTKSITLKVRPSYADNVLCVGPRYQPQDVHFHFPSLLGQTSSGVFVIGVNKGHMLSRAISKCKLTKCFQIKGILGQASQNFKITSKPLAKAKYEHVDKFLMNKILASYQATHHRRIFEEYGIKLDSQEAYDFAVSGLHRPSAKGNTVIYDLKCIEFESPNFTIEIQCLNENEKFLMNLIHNLGISLKCLASCTGIRCIRQGCFLVEHTILKKHWTVKNIIKNMNENFNLLSQQYPDAIRYYPTVNVSQESSSFV